jgi:predicted RNA binding protein YcfA (HicA-like mRNA interferase family)
LSRDNRWDRCRRNPDKAIRTIRRSAREQNFDLRERQTGSHWIGKVPNKGSVVVPRHGEIPRGTWGSIMRMLKAIGLIAIIIFLYLNFY